MSAESFRVSQLNQFIKDVLNAGLPQPVWVCGELQQYDRNRSKTHIFFELVEKDEKTHEIVARAGLVIFANRKPFIESKLKKSENAFELKDDIEVKFLCKVDFYSPHGTVRLIVEDIDPFYTMGKLAQERLKLIAKLKENGTLDKNKRLDLPLVPLRIGLITAYDSAAYNDFISELGRSSFGFVVYLRNTVMQGKRTEADVVRALDELQTMQGLDVVVITRGGGSIAELSCFDSAGIAEKIAAVDIPVLSGIGHEINTTITDLAAHTFLKTPTAVAQFLVERVSLFRDTLDDLGRTVTELGRNVVENKRQYLRENAYRLQSFTNNFLKVHEGALAKAVGAVLHKPSEKIKHALYALDDSRGNLVQSTNRRLQGEQKRLMNCDKLIGVLRPEHTLKRGFSLTRDSSGKTIKRAADLPKDSMIITELFKGSIESKVISVNSVK